jgi:hypothetical protein
MFAADFYTYDQREESDPDPVHHVQAETVGEACSMIHELLDPMFTQVSFRFVDHDDESMRFEAVSPIDERTVEINGTVDVYELRDGEPA